MSRDDLEAIERERVRETARSMLFGARAAQMRVGRFEVLRRLGEGASGIVYLANDPLLERKVALKVLRAGFAQDRLLAEAKVMAQLAHPNVVAVHEVGAHEERPYIAMAFVDGETLREWSTRAGRTWRAVLIAFLDAGRGLAAAHAAGIVHRDFKPENVLVDANDHVLVTDFGLARSTHAHEEARVDLGARETSSGTSAVLGTPSYLAPEVLRGTGADAKSDQFSFAVALAELVSGAHPFPGSTPAARMRAIALGKLRLQRSAGPEALYRVLSRALSPAPEDRYADMNALLRALESSLTASRRRWIAAAALLLVPAAALLFSDRSADLPVLTDTPPKSTPHLRTTMMPAPDAAVLSSTTVAVVAEAEDAGVSIEDAGLTIERGSLGLLALPEPRNDPGRDALDRGEYELAIQRYRQALADAERRHPETDPRVAAAHDALGAAHLAFEQYAEAIAAFDRAITLVTAARGTEAPDLVRPLRNLALAQLHAGETAEAGRTAQRAHQLALRIFGDEDAETAETHHALGSWHRTMRRAREGVANHKKAIALLEAALGRSHQRLIEPLLGEAIGLIQIGHPQMALERLERAEKLCLARTERSLPLARTYFLLATILWETEGTQKRALKLAEQARAMYASYGREHTRLERWLAARK